MYIWVYIKSMTRRYSIAAARASLSSLLDEVQAGHAVELTRRGKPVAVLISSQTYQRLRADPPDFAAAFRGFLERFRPEEVGIDREFFESLRAPDAGREVEL